MTQANRFSKWEAPGLVTKEATMVGARLKHHPNLSINNEII